MAKKESTKLYKVTLLASGESGAKRTYYRGGRQFTVLEPQLIELTDEEVKVYADDKRIKLSEASDADLEANESESTSDSEEDSSDDSGSESSDESEEDDSTEDSDSEDSSSDEAEENSDDTTESTEVEPLTVDGLVKNNSRNELNALAVEAGVEAPEALAGKPEVAQAIVDAQASNSDESEEATS